MKKSLYTSAILAALAGAADGIGSLFTAPENKTRYNHRMWGHRNSTEIINHNAAIDAAKAEKKARRAQKG